MGSAGIDDSSQRAIEGDLLDVGNRLLDLPSSTDELLVLLQKAEGLLTQVWQQPPMSTCNAFVPIMKALIKEEIMHHVDVNIQVAVAACFSEFSRISAPTDPYPDHLMRVFFQLIMVAFQQLPSESGCNYSRVRKILETMAKVRSALMLLDIDNDGLVVEMFWNFLNNIRSSHPPDVSECMEMIMSSVIAESDELSFELLRPLLDSVRKENKISSPVSFNLGEKVFKNCAAKIQPYIKEAMKEMDLDPDEYTEIVTSLYHDVTNGENMAAAAKLEGSTSLASGENGSKLDGGDTSSETFRGSQQTVKPGMGSEAPPRKRGRKPKSVIRPEEVNEHTPSPGGKYSGEVSSEAYNHRKKDQVLQSEVGDKGMLSDPAKKKGNSSNVASQGKRGRPRKNVVGEQNDLEKLKKKEKDPAKSMQPGKDKEKKSRKSRVKYGEELINERLKVWWPMDETFYAGTVTDYDPATKKHKILYDDNEVEVLNLRKETWELVRKEEQLQQEQETERPSTIAEPVKMEEKITKRKLGTSRKQHGPSSSKRSKREHSILNASGENSVLNDNEKPNNGTSGLNNSQKDVEENPAGEEASEC